MATLLRIVPDVSVRLGNASRTKIYELINAGEFEAVRCGGRRLVIEQSLDAYIERLREETAAEAGA